MEINGQYKLHNSKDCIHRKDTWYIDFEKGLGFKYKVENVLVSFKVCKGVIKLPYFYIGSYFARKLGV